MVGPQQFLGRLDRDAGTSTLTQQHFTGSLLVESGKSYFMVAAVDNGGPSLGFLWDSAQDGTVDGGVPWKFGSDFTGDGVIDVDINWDSTTFGANWNTSSFTERGYIKIEATAVPEPSAALLLGLGGALAAIRRRRRA